MPILLRAAQDDSRGGEIDQTVSLLRLALDGDVGASLDMQQVIEGPWLLARVEQGIADSNARQQGLERGLEVLVPAAVEVLEKEFVGGVQTAQLLGFRAISGGAMPSVGELLQLARTSVWVGRSIGAQYLDEVLPVAPAAEALEGSEADLMQGQGFGSGDGTFSGGGFQLGHPKNRRWKTDIEPPDEDPERLKETAKALHRVG
ncbi:hypothetical protein [Cystobacter fuscus]|uniref:hypothetical protein n=1 Tax=Cystobacter fuscus TaxID=43 RepID=UPI0018DFAAAE|nr:hypothetical protein [Cystobacter fuscus]